ARLGVPQLRGAFDDREDVEHRGRRVQPLPRQHAAGGLSWLRGHLKRWYASGGGGPRFEMTSKGPEATLRLLRERRIAPSILSGGFAPLRHHRPGGVERRAPGG